MYTGSITTALLRRSVVSVPPLARHADLSLSEAGNAAIVGHMRAGGVSTFMYGGNANLYNVGVGEYPALLDMLEKIAGPDEWMVPSIGPDFGKACDQIDVLKGRKFPTAMLLPPRTGFTQAGIVDGLRRLADRYGKPVIAYIKEDGYVDPVALAGAVKSGHVCAIKYAIVRKDPAPDAFLTALLGQTGVDPVISGMGERPIVVHAEKFGLRAFTSGSVCVGPRLSMDILRAITRGDMAEAARLRTLFMPLEDVRDAYGPIAVIHEAMRLGKVAEAGPLLPFMVNIDQPAILKEIEAAAGTLRALNDSPARRAAE